MVSKKKLIFPGLGLAFLIAVRVIAPSIILSKTNDYLASFSPIVRAHVDEIDLSILRGSFFAKGIEATVKEDQIFFYTWKHWSFHWHGQSSYTVGSSQI